MAVSEKNFPIGIDNFEKIISNGMVYIDKTEYLEELLKSGTEISLLLRPRRFGKTLTMSMLSCFLEMNYQNPCDIQLSVYLSRMWMVKIIRRL